MSLITLFYGQCGNQISDSLYSNLHAEICNSKKDDYYQQTTNKWFHITKTNKWQPRSILIDTESKTVPKKNSYQFRNILGKSRGGSANNFAFGYFEQSKLLQDEIEECVRKELEKSDLGVTFLNIFSSSGGTGGGVGTHITEFLKTEHPNKVVTNALILPYSSGELVTQSYNSLLVISKIYPLSDAIILFENDRLHYNCSNSLNLTNVAFADINNLIARQLLSIYQPMNVKPCDLFTKFLCEDPRFKFLKIRSAPLSQLDDCSNWKSLLASLSRQSRFDFQQNAKNNNGHVRPRSLSTAVVCRGGYVPAEADLKTFRDLNVCKSVKVYHQRRRIFGLENCLSVVSNTSDVFGAVNSLLSEGLSLYKFGAYLHHYEKFGVAADHFKGCFGAVERILADYKRL